MAVVMVTHRQLGIAACALATAIVITAAPASYDGNVELETQITWDVNEPPLALALGIVRNSSDARIHGWSSVSLEERKPCPEGQYSHWMMKNSDPRLASQVAFDMPPGSWFASWQPYWNPAASCELRGEVVLTSHAGGPEVATLLRHATIPARPERPSLPPSGIEGMLEFEAIVWNEEFILHGREPSGDALQLQLLVRNKAQSSRTVAITARSIVCDSSSFAFVVGPGAGHPAMTSGPIALSANGWGVLAQRIRGSGDPSTCRYELVISELRAMSDLALQVGDYSAKHWIEVTTIKGQLMPIGMLSYLSY